MLNVSGKRVVVTGGSGFLGNQIVNEIKNRNAKSIFIPRSAEHDLRLWHECVAVTKRADVVIHAAGDVGGIGYNRDFPGTLFYSNLMMGVQLMEASRLAQVKKFVAIGTVCAYPKLAPTPFKEEDLWNGYPEETNAPYGLAKKMLLVQSQAYRQQYGFNSIYLIPVNLYGPGDHFEDTKSHVIPALIKKITTAKSRGDKTIPVWGTGKATREFIYVDDAARAIALDTEKYDKSDPVNIGSGMEISIADLVDLICQIVGFKGKVIWDKTKPDGQPRRKLDVSRAKKEFGFTAKVDFKTGLEKTIAWYQAQT